MNTYEKMLQTVERLAEEAASDKKGNRVKNVKEYIRNNPEYVRPKKMQEAIVELNEEYEWRFTAVSSSVYVAFHKDSKGRAYYCSVKDTYPRNGVCCRIMLPLIGTEYQMYRYPYVSILGNIPRFKRHVPERPAISFWGIHAAVIKNTDFDVFANDPVKFVDECFNEARRVYDYYKSLMEQDELFPTFVQHRMCYQAGKESGFYKDFCEMIKPKLADFTKPPYKYYTHIEKDKIDTIKTIDMLIYSIVKESLLTAVLDLAQFYCDNKQKGTLDILQSLAPDIPDPDASNELSRMFIFEEDPLDENAEEI